MDELTTMAMGKIPSTYMPPRRNCVLLSCMDLRLIDQLTAFMDRDNLTNRYDHLIFAGAALGVLQTTYPGWQETFKQHLAVAVKLHEPEDIYIVEHRNCGAYLEFLGLDFDEHHQHEEQIEHTRWATRLRLLLEEWWPELAPKRDGKTIPLHVHGFLMDLRGDVELLDLSAQPDLADGKPRKSRKTKKG